MFDSHRFSLTKYCDLTPYLDKMKPVSHLPASLKLLLLSGMIPLAGIAVQDITAFIDLENCPKAEHLTDLWLAQQLASPSRSGIDRPSVHQQSVPGSMVPHTQRPSFFLFCQSNFYRSCLILLLHFHVTQPG